MERYIHRKIEQDLAAAAKQFPVIMITGPRQTGKSTLLKTVFQSHLYVTLDDPVMRKVALGDPETFLRQAERMIIDEIQYCPELLPYIKIAVDKSREERGRFLLTGSQVFPLMAGASESLAGRVALFELMPFSTEEAPWLSVDDSSACFAAIHKGFYPEVVVHGVDRNLFFSSYVQTYLDRDIRHITSVHDLRIFHDFMELLAARAGGLLNLSEISKEAGISHASARRWLSLLESTRIVYLLRPYASNISKRVIKSPKLYFLDTGLLAFLLRYPDSSTLKAGPQAGAFFETFIVTELLKYRFNHGKSFELSFYRDSQHNEVDLIVDAGLSRALFEIKLTMTPRSDHAASLKKIMPLLPGAPGNVLCFSQATVPLSGDVNAVPWRKVFDLLPG